MGIPVPFFLFSICYFPILIYFLFLYSSQIRRKFVANVLFKKIFHIFPFPPSLDYIFLMEYHKFSKSCIFRRVQ